MDAPEDEFRHVFARQLRYFDQEMTEYRSVYDSLKQDERRDLRQWLEAVQSLGDKCPFEWHLEVKVEHDIYDERGEKVDERNAEFMAWTMLAAMDCWDKGEPFVPNSILP